VPDIEARGWSKNRGPFLVLAQACAATCVGRRINRAFGRRSVPYFSKTNQSGPFRPPTRPYVKAAFACREASGARKKLPVRRNPAEVPLTRFFGPGIYPALFYRIPERQIRKLIVAGVPQVESPSDAAHRRRLRPASGARFGSAVRLRSLGASSTALESVQTEQESCESRKENRVENRSEHSHRPDLSRAGFFGGPKLGRPRVPRERRLTWDDGRGPEFRLSAGRSTSEV